MVKVQYFIFFPDNFEASEVSEELEREAIEDWDYALKVDGEIETLYAAVGDRPTKWMAEGSGINGLGLKLTEPGRHGYQISPGWKRFGK